MLTLLISLFFSLFRNIKIFIRHENNFNKILFECHAKDTRKAVEKAVSLKISLAGADLAGADLTNAYLFGANLTGAYLVNAYLTDANLFGADLTCANLSNTKNT